ncbi:hypothetical protein AO366_0425 [Moraxella catarrhalis]|uniref:Uncharacterized protein n=1 Tax=Moraxella catarrhalis TaxID=480 RepID=A0A7Z1A4U1_MORCA|nr:hypothetical protein [Moraxella catarrhalis]OAV02162.1 hypothetical protein AO382_0528 [Moraxella catarrhalis]OAV03571.1 hypothetical protein AO381_1075 [Moraxella catarrhalis]OAV06063.1 hypothetical protein AO379_1139 [Moraxella catarrhalis]OAV18411.1 hypothetical protein AO373_0995 [Moraxella catarrhalis]OAV19849.1 hypothetical protein AO372_1819 [Moraxella catarrhalis]
MTFNIANYLFDGLTNLNDGFDVPGIIYVSEIDFEILLNRAEAKNINIWGIEPWFNGEFYGVEIYEDYNLPANDPNWYRQAFEKFKKENRNLQYAISFG